MSEIGRIIITAKIVFILGAGASKESGVPLMDHFLDEARDLYANDFSNDTDFDLVLKSIGKLQIIASKSEINISNIESVYSTLEMAKIVEKFGEYTPNQIDDLLRSFQNLIVKTIEKKMEYPFINNSNKPDAPPQYSYLFKIIEQFREKNRKTNTVALITFNYDIGIDYAAYLNNILIDYCLEKNSNNVPLPLLKLHGSLNWAECTVCKKIIPYYFKDFFKNKHFSNNSEGGFKLLVQQVY